MDKTFSYLNLCSIYRSEGYANREMGRYACFAKTLTLWQNKSASNVQSVHYEIVLMKGLDSIKETQYNNACLLNKREIKDWLKVVKSYHNFKYRLEDGDYSFNSGSKKYDAFHLHIEMTGNHTQHKWVLTAIRHLYEYPFNLWLIDAHRLRATDPQKFRGESLLNIMQSIKSSFPNGHQTDQSLMYKKKQFHSKKYVIKKIDSGISYITNIYEANTKTQQFAQIAKEGAACLGSFDWWMGEKYFVERAKIYHENYDKIKQETQPEV